MAESPRHPTPEAQAEQRIKEILRAADSSGTFTLLIPSALAIAVVLGVLVILANYLPARKLVVMEPAEALRHA